MNNRPLLVLGTYGLAAEVAELAEESGFKVEAFVENHDRGRTRAPLQGRPVYWIAEVSARTRTTLVICSLGTTHRYRLTEQALELGFTFATVVHPRAHVSSSARVGAGTLVSAGVIVGSNSHIGDNVLVNRGALIGHDTTIGDHASIQPGSNIAGFCTIGERAWIGMSATVIERSVVGRGAIVGAGAVVTKDVPDRAKVVGVPARVVAENVEGL